MADAPRGAGVEEDVVIHHGALVVVLFSYSNRAHGGQNVERHDVDKMLALRLTYDTVINSSTAVPLECQANCHQRVGAGLPLELSGSLNQL